MLFFPENFRIFPQLCSAAKLLSTTRQARSWLWGRFIISSFFNSRSRAVLGREKKKNPTIKQKHNTQNPSQPEFHRQVAVPLATFKNNPSNLMAHIFQVPSWLSKAIPHREPVFQVASTQPFLKTWYLPWYMDYRENQTASLVETLLCTALDIHKAQYISWFLQRALMASTLKLPLFAAHSDSR